MTGIYNHDEYHIYEGRDLNNSLARPTGYGHTAAVLFFEKFPDHTLIIPIGKYS